MCPHVDKSRWGRANIRHSKPQGLARLPAERDVHCHLVDFSLERETFAGERQKLQAFVVGEHRVFEARSGSLQSNEGLG